MSEGLSATAKWEDVDQGTFVRFAQFLYIGDYSTPKLVIGPSPPPVEIYEEPLPPSSENNLGWGGLGRSGKKGRKTSPSRTSASGFEALSYPLPTPRFNFQDTCDPTLDDGPSENVSEILHLHASLYVLAEKWGIDKLKMLTLFKIHKTLSWLSLDAPKLEHIIHFIRYAYERTPDQETKMDGLRELICQYIAANAEFTSRDAGFMALFEEGGPLARDLWKLVAPRVN